MGTVIKLVIAIVVSVFSIIVFGNVMYAQSQQHQALQNTVNQGMKDLDSAATNLIDVCSTTKSIDGLNNCKSELNTLINNCKDSSYSSMSSCNDPRIGQFFSTVDSKISYARSKLASDASDLNTAIQKQVNLCYQARDANTLAECKTMMLQVQQDCNTETSYDSYVGPNSLPICQDPRITQILNEQINQPSNVYDAANQNMESFMNMCMSAQDNNTIQNCATKARQMIFFCKNTSVQACNDPRLQQIANLDQPQPVSNQINTTAFNDLNNKMQNVINSCTSNTISNQDVCIKAMNMIRQDCNSTMEKTFSSYFQVCNDPRLAK
jgi:hypothetical protein